MYSRIYLQICVVPREIITISQQIFSYLTVQGYDKREYAHLFSHFYLMKSKSSLYLTNIYRFFSEEMVLLHIANTRASF